jgi:hypothetical protein
MKSLNLVHQHGYTFQRDFSTEGMSQDDVNIGADGLWLAFESSIPAVVGVVGLKDPNVPAVEDLHLFELNSSPLRDAKTIVEAIAIGVEGVGDNEGVRAGGRDGIKSIAAAAVGTLDGIGHGLVDACNRCRGVGIVQVSMYSCGRRLRLVVRYESHSRYCPQWR